MPELPDVEALRRHLISRGLVGRTITGAELLWPRALRAPAERKFRSDVRGRRIQDIRRRAKYLILSLDGPSSRALVVHLRMTGSLQLLPAGSGRPQHTRNVLLLDGGLELCFVDPRKLGMMWLVADETEVLSGLGPEPLDPAFTSEVLGRVLAGRDVPVKALLCDQAVVAGIGNIYADEVLFMAGIHPLRRGGEMSQREVGTLHEAIVGRLSEATELLVSRVIGGGAPTGNLGDRELFLVPRSEGGACVQCGAPVGRVQVRGRSSYYCPGCQTE